jgi:L-threonylcarbamoyladenylate synthase
VSEGRSGHEGPEIARAVAILRGGGLVAFPTETVYGLGADASNAGAMRRLYATKGRPADHPVIVHLGHGDLLDEWAIAVPPVARALAAACWPGPLTLVLRRSDRVADEVTGGRETVGLRVPGHPLALELLQAFGGGLAAPSANRFGRVSPTTAQHVRDELGDDVDLVLDGGPCDVGVESTIVDCTAEPRVLRVGAVSAEQLRAITGEDLPVGGTTPAPGTLPSHYSPAARVEVVSVAALGERVTALLGAGRQVGVIAAPAAALEDRAGMVTLATPRDVEAYARELYAALRRADVLGLDVVLAVPPEARGIGVAVIDRLGRAAAPS